MLPHDAGAAAGGQLDADDAGGQFLGFQSGTGTLTLARLTLDSLGGTKFAQVDVQFENLTVEPIQWQ